MKKKIFFAIFMALMLFSVFAVAASAAEITYSADFGEATYVDGMPTIDGISTDARVVLRNSDGTYTTYPTYYIMKNSKTFGTDYTNLNAKNALGQTYNDSTMILIEIPDGVTGISGNLFGMDSTNHPTKNLEKIVILTDDYTKIGEQTFRRMPTVKSVTIPASVTRIDSWAFCGSPALQEVIFAEGSLLESTGNSFKDCTALSSINLEACTKLKTLGASFSGCTSLRKIALPDSIETIGNQAFYRIGEFELASDYLPKNLKSIGTHFLSGNTVKNEVLYFPEGFTEFSASYHFNDGYKPATSLTLVFLGKMTNVNVSNAALVCFTNNGTKQPLNLIFAKNTYSDLGGDFVQGVDFNGNQGYISKHADGSAPYTAKTGTLIVNLQNNDPNSGAELGKDANGNTVCKAEGAPAKLIFCGGDTVEYSYSVRNNHTDKGWYRFHTTSWTYDLDAHKTANVHYNSIVYQAGNCGYDETTTTTCVICKLQSVITGTLATGEHTYTDDFNCETALNCETCKKTLAEALTHDIIVAIVYENGYTDKGEKTTKCAHEGCNIDVTEDANAIFSFKGVSTKISDTVAGITFGYNIDKEALGEYEAANGKLKHGFVVTFAGLLGDNAPIVNGEKATVDGCNIVMADSSDGNYTASEFVLKGEKSLWESEEVLVNGEMLKDAKLILACYTIDTANNVTYFNYDSSDSAYDFAASYSEISQVEA